MANILAKYGIKEVADVVFYDIDSTGAAAAPVLYLDTLKVSTIEQTAEQTEATGGKGNPPLIIWDYGKEINVTLEDALFSPKSLSVMFSDGTINDTEIIKKTIQHTATTGNTGVPTTWIDARGGTQPITDPAVYDATGMEVKAAEPATDIVLVAGEVYFITFNVATESISSIEISANTFPGTYYITGDTYARSQVTGLDDYFQFIVPKAKMNAENTITLEAEGDPSVFDLSLRVLRPNDGKMMKLVQYTIGEGSQG